MRILDRLFGKGQTPPPSGGPAIELPVLMAALDAHLPALEKKQIQPALVRARLADWVRDAGLEPPGPDQMGEWTAALEPDGWRRLALLLAAVEVDVVGAVLAHVAATRDVHWVVKEGLIGTAASVPLLTLGLLRESPVRLEELARGWLSVLGATIVGETAAESAERLVRIDYRRLLSEAERAKQEAEERMAELRKRQEKAEQLRAGRSKW